MKRALAGALILAVGGPLVFAAGFLPWGNSRTHWVVLSESADSLLSPPEDEPLTRFQVAFYGGEVAGLAYPMIAGLAILLSAFLVRGPAAAAAFLLLHAAPFLALAAAAMALSIPDPAMSLSGKVRILLGGTAALSAVLLAAEAVVLIRSARASPRPSGYLVDRLNLLPAAFLLLVNAGLGIYFSRGSHDWAWQGYPVGAVGSAAALLGIGLRWRVRAA